jgi:uncharacterized protein YciI
MAYFLMTYDLIADYINRRGPLRQEHLRLAAESQARGELVMGGALTDPANKAVIVFRCADPSVAERFARNDPYVKNGLVVKWEVRPWNVVIGGSEHAPT